MFRKYESEEAPVDAIQKIIDFDLCFESWVGVKALDNTKDEEFINLANSVVDISQWLKIYEQSEPEGLVESFTFKKITRFDMPSDDELRFCHCTKRKNPNHFGKATNALVKKTTDVDGLVEIYLSNFGESINESVLRKIRKSKASYEKWCEIRDSCKTSEKSPLKEVAINKANKYKKA